MPDREEWLCNPSLPVDFPTITLCMLRNSYNFDVAVMKIDCEGCEFDALATAEAEAELQQVRDAGLENAS